MSEVATDSAPRGQWTLIRGARQLLTLRGASGPRRGSAMSDLHIVPDGAVLIRDGIIEEAGSTRRIENLAMARMAREINASGKVVMPAFADPDNALTAPGTAAEPDVRRMSKRRLEGQAASVAAELARYGVLTVGAHTLDAHDLKNSVKALRAHQALQSKPLRIRSIYAPPYPAEDESGAQLQRICETWIPGIARKKLAAIIEIPVCGETIAKSRVLAAAAAANGFSIRVRVTGHSTVDVLELAYSAGAVALLGSIPATSAVSRALADVGCVRVTLASRILADKCTSKRNAIDDGIPVALGSGYRNSGTASFNPQFLLYMACQRLGMTVEEAIVAATYNAVCSLRLSHVTGSLEPGKAADICIMEVDDYHELTRRAGHHDACLVMRAGKIVYRRPNLIAE